MLRLPIWDAGIGNTRNPDLDFTLQYIVGRRRIVFETLEMDMDMPTHMRLQTQPQTIEWLKACGDVVARLPRRHLCVLHMYTLQNVYMLVNDYLRAGGKTARHKGLRKYLGVVPGSLTTATATKAVAVANLDDFLEGKTPEDIKALYLLPHCADDDPTVSAFVLNWQYKKRQGHLTRTFTRALPCFNETIVADIMAHTVLNSPGVILYRQAKAVLTQRRADSSDLVDPGQQQVVVSCFQDFLRVLPHITDTGWQRIVQRYVDDLDRIYECMPASGAPVTVYRGTHGPVPRGFPSDPAFTSTSLSERIAKTFTSKQQQQKKKCCVHKITLPPGSRAIPVMCATRYYAELELLLPRGGRRG